MNVDDRVRKTRLATNKTEQVTVRATGRERPKKIPWAIRSKWLPKHTTAEKITIPHIPAVGSKRGVSDPLKKLLQKANRL